MKFWSMTVEMLFYLISCICFGKQYVLSATGLKERFRIHKSDIMVKLGVLGQTTFLMFVALLLVNLSICK